MGIIVVLCGGENEMVPETQALLFLKFNKTYSTGANDALTGL